MFYFEMVLVNFLHRKCPRSQGSILFCTTGIVLKFLEGDGLVLLVIDIVYKSLMNDLCTAGNYYLHNLCYVN